jgi:hypothetical protein
VSRAERFARLPPAFRCHEQILAARTASHPFRAPIVTLSRLLLLHTLARQPPAFGARLAAVVGGMAAHFRHPLRADKVLARPAALSPGEYAALIWAMLTALAHPPDDLEALGRWAALFTAWERLWDCSDESESD